ncbi:uncharacterized protein EI97DRAFT_429578 [Westerdykella ornata]|uniref:FAR1 domain-containing protein n=1 Tax=Westerdykella ornata TaxID=318751 RepID=A0A6A6K0C9_WESOR|nr:uncharacterized protein EI97DRAFT_429578 [Westerdykella ornata]KAF2281568.1 hypothetical protein EI97DRAFT_429578 [Westerdykella ornata]
MSAELHTHAHHTESNVSIYPPFPSFPGEPQPVDPSIGNNIPDFEHERGETPTHDVVAGSGQHQNSYFGASPTTQRHGSAQEISDPSRVAFVAHDLPIAENITSSEQFDMLPPPASVHPSWQALHDYAQRHASAHGYALSINTTAKNRSRIKLACVCYGAPKNTHKLTPETRIRKNRVSYKTGCRMWVESKKQDDGSWLLRVGEPQHNHPGRPPDKWAMQRKRTWGMLGGRVGVGGVTAKEEKERLGSTDERNPLDEPEEHSDTPRDQAQADSHSMERGSLVWKIVEQEMAYAGGRGQGRDRGVGRTVKILQERLPGIHILKRDVYNIRAQIKRARKTGQSTRADTADGAGEPTWTPEPSAKEDGENDVSEIDPALVVQQTPDQNRVFGQEDEIERLKEEVATLRQALVQRAKEVEERDALIRDLQAQIERASTVIRDEGEGP